MADVMMKAFPTAVHLTAKSNPDGVPTVRRATFTISTGDVDREGDTIDPNGWDLENYRKNPVVLFGHDYKSLPIAKAIDVHVTPRGLVATAEFPPPGVHPQADQVWGLMQFGLLNATSVGFRPIEREYDHQRKGWNYLRQELLEFSIVPVPANANALLAASKAGLPVALLKDWARGILADESEDFIRLETAEEGYAFQLDEPEAAIDPAMLKQVFAEEVLQLVEDA